MKKIYIRLLLISSITLLFNGCNQSPIPAEQVLKVDSKLQPIEMTKNGVVVEMDEIAFEWKRVTDLNVEGIKIYKSTADSNTTELIKTIENRYSTHFVDLDIKPDTKYNYIFRTYRDDVVSKESKLISVYSKPPLASVSWIYAINGLPRMAKIIWRPHINDSVEYYIVERKTIDDDEWKTIAKIKGRLSAEFIDKDLKDRYTYRYRVRVKTYNGIVSTPSEIVKVVTKPLPPQILGLKASTDLPKEIYLTWNKSNYKDFERYYLYRADSKNGRYELIAKLYNNRFTDHIDKDGAKYFYKISQKDIDGLESNKDDFIVMGSTLPKPIAPTISDASLQGNKIIVKWYKVDPRSVRYVVRRKAKTGWFDVKEKDFYTTSKEFVDENILPNTKYIYEVYAIDKNDIISKPSNEAVVEVKDVKVLNQPILTNEKEIKNTQKSVKNKTNEVKEEVQKVAPVDTLEVE
jgi:fibronectin type 3 domain-containing protein